jgi:probable F420-dependent oxidoreductase
LLLKFGIRLPNSGPLANTANLARVAEQAEHLGFHSIWVHDHVLWGSEQHRTHLSAGSAEALDELQKPNFYESITTLAYLAGRTQEVKLGIAVLVLPLRNPVVAAKQLANLDVLSGGRLILGVAPGAPNITRSEFEAIGAPYEERGKVADEYIKALRALWSQNLATYSGKYTIFKEAQLFPKPLQRNLPILIGGGERGLSQRALRRVIEFGDGWIPAYLTSEEIREGISEIHKAASSNLERRREEEGALREKDYFVAHEMFTAIDEDTGNAAKKAAKSLGSNFVSLEEGVKRSLVGNPGELREKLEHYASAGVHLTELKFIYSDIDSLIQMMKLFSSEILPSFS